jgi:hypothetical protein
MIPDSELDRYLDDVTAAVDLARAGDVDGGFRVLLAGRDRVRDMSYGGRAWKDDLQWEYDSA